MASMIIHTPGSYPRWHAARSVVMLTSVGMCGSVSALRSEATHHPRTPSKMRTL